MFKISPQIGVGDCTTSPKAQIMLSFWISSVHCGLVFIHNTEVSIYTEYICDGRPGIAGKQILLYHRRPPYIPFVVQSRSLVNTIGPTMPVNGNMMEGEINRRMKRVACVVKASSRGEASDLVNPPPLENTNSRSLRNVAGFCHCPETGTPQRFSYSQAYLAAGRNMVSLGKA